MNITVILPTRHPDPGRIRRTLDSLAAQTFESGRWELVVVDNGEKGRELQLPPDLIARFPAAMRIIPERTPGLTSARLAGIAAALGAILVFADDDNVLDPGYLAAVAERFAAGPGLGAAGGPVVPEWESTPPSWTREFHGLLALRDFGPVPRVCPGGPGAPWPDFAPVGAGLAIRAAHARAYAEALGRDPRRRALDRKGASLGSGGDNDLVFTALHAGGGVAYFPELRVTHLIPAFRLGRAYLGRLNEGIMRTWVMVLRLHGQCPWPPIAPWTAGIRCLRAWFRSRAWRSDANHVRWRGMCGQFRGQADIYDFKTV